MEKKTMLGQFYTTRSEYIIGNLISDVPEGSNAVEPFCGQGDLISDRFKFETYDIDPKMESCTKRNTLLDPPVYEGKYVITNPPFLARNKNKDKTIYDLYGVGDLYKAAVKSILECQGGILIIPLNFICDEDNATRKEFFERFEIININVFEETVFDDTTYTICAFSFRRSEYSESRILKCKFFPTGEETNFTIEGKSGWRIGSEFFDIIDSASPKGISRLRIEGTPNSNLYLRAIDTGTENGRICLSVNKEHHYGKETDRSFATIITDKHYTEEEEIKICEEFNKTLEENRSKYKSMFLTNFRNSTSSYARKRISFDVAYRLIAHSIKKLGI